MCLHKIDVWKGTTRRMGDPRGRDLYGVRGRGVWGIQAITSKGPNGVQITGEYIACPMSCEYHKKIQNIDKKQYYIVIKKLFVYNFV